MFGMYRHGKYIKVPHNILERTTHIKLTFYNIQNEKKSGNKNASHFLLSGLFEPNNNALINHVLYINDNLMHGYIMTNIIKEKDNVRCPISTDILEKSRVTGLSDRFKLILYTYSTSDEQYSVITSLDNNASIHYVITFYEQRLLDKVTSL